MEIKKISITEHTNQNEYNVFKCVFLKVLGLCKANSFYCMELTVTLTLLLQGVVVFNVLYYVTDNNDGIIGFLLASVGDNETNIAYFLVDKLLRNNSIGSNMLNEFITDHISHTIVTETNDKNSLKYFIKRKFNVIGKTGKFLKLKYDGSK